MDHYQEVLLAHAVDDHRYLKMIELEVMQEAHDKGRLTLEGFPDHFDMGRLRWYARGLPPEGVIWESFDPCKECDGAGEIEATSKTFKTYDVECPACGGNGDAQDAAPINAEVLTDHFGNFIKVLP